MKYFRMSYEEVVFERSYINLILLNRAIPGIKPFESEKEEGSEPKEKKKKILKEQYAGDFFMNFM